MLFRLQAARIMEPGILKLIGILMLFFQAGNRLLFNSPVQPVKKRVALPYFK